jgi:hypothetical protein
MRTRLLLLAGTGAIIVVAGFGTLNFRPDGEPLLIFKGYSARTTNGTQLATFELRNPSKRAIWLCYSGTEFPLKAEFLERPMTVPTCEENTQQTNVYILSVGSFFMQGEKVLPGGSLMLEFPLISGKPASQIGVCCYAGKFSDGNDFLSHLGTPLLDQKATWKEKGEFYFENARRRFKAPKRYEIWCSQPVCLQPSRSDTPARRIGAGHE